VDIDVDDELSPEIQDLDRLQREMATLASLDRCPALLALVGEPFEQGVHSVHRVVMLQEALDVIVAAARRQALTNPADSLVGKEARQVAAAGELLGFHDDKVFAEMCQQAFGDQWEKKLAPSMESKDHQPGLGRRRLHAAIWVGLTSGRSSDREAPGVLFPALLVELRRTLQQRRGNTPFEEAGTSSQDSTNLGHRHPMNATEALVVLGDETQKAHHSERQQLLSVRPPTLAMPLRGRDRLLAQLEHALAPGALYVIVGGGGFGKTTLAQALATRAVDNAMRVFWASATDEASLSRSMKLIAKEVGAPAAAIDAAWKDDRPSGAPDLLWSHLNEIDYPWLLVVDEADQPRMLADKDRVFDGRGWVRPSPGGAVLVTSRNGDADTWRPAKVVEISDLETGDAAAVLADRLTRSTDEDLAHPEVQQQIALVADRLGGHPLALHLAGTTLGLGLAVAQRREPTIPGFQILAKRIAWFKAELDSDLGYLDEAHARDQADDPRRLILSTFKVTLGLLAGGGYPEATPLMHVVSCFASAPLPLDVLDVEAFAESELLAVQLSDFRLEALIQAIIDHGLMSFVNGGGSEGAPQWCVRVHRLILEAIAHDVERLAPPASESVWTVAGRVLERATAEHDPLDSRTWTWWQYVYPHCLQAIQCYTGSEPSVTKLLVDSSRRTLRALMESGAHPMGLQLAEGLMDPAERALGGESETYLSLRTDYAMTLRLMGRGGEAIRHFDSVIETATRVLGEGHQTTVRAMSGLARAVRRRGGADGLAKSLSAYEHILELQQINGHKEKDILQTRASIARAWRTQGRWRESRQVFETILERRRTLFGEDTEQVLRNRNDLALVLGLLGEYEKATEELRQVRRVRMERSPNGASALSVRRRYAASLIDLGNYREAHRELKEVLALRIRFFGWNHPDTIRAGTSLAEVTRLMGEVDHAEGDLRLLLERAERLVGVANAMTLIVRRQHALALADCAHGNDLLRALTEMKDVVDRRLDLYGELNKDHPDIMTARLDRGSILRRLGRCTEAQVDVDYVCDRRSELFGAEHPDTLRALYEKGLLLRDSGSASEAHDLLVVVYARQVEQLGVKHPLNKAIKKALASV
jgi:tetratricopeptide (TPR) repeat protein